MTSEESVEGGLAEPTELEPDQGSLALADPSDDHDRAEWEAAAAAVLRKAGRLGVDDADDLVWQNLAHTTLDGLSVTPLGTPDLLDGLATAGRPTRVGGWDVRTRPADREQALADLDTGATSLWVDADADLRTLLDGVLFDLAPVVLDGTTPEMARVFLDLLTDVDPADGTNLGAEVSTSSTDVLVEIAELARGAGVLAAVVDGTVVHDRGASDVQELAHALAAAATYLRTLTGAGFSVAEAAGLLEFRLAATDEQFPTIAKFRAARRSWARMLELSESDDVPMRLHAVTSRPMMSKYDPWVNMLRTTVATFGAGIGGADSITVIPFDSPLGEPDAFGRRIARNTSPLLLSESHLGRVADPAGGAYAVERLTDDLALAAWEELGRIESEGAAAFEERVAETVAARDAAVATRQRPLTGLSEFPNLAESLPERVSTGSTAVQQAHVRRWGAAFEELRDQPAASPVFLATMGSVADHTARAGFATNVLAAGGVAVDGAGATDGVESLLEAYDGQQVVCLAGADPAYAEWGADLVAALRDAGARHVVVAGKADIGADDQCHAGMDALDFLRRTREVLT